MKYEKDKQHENFNVRDVCGNNQQDKHASRTWIKGFNMLFGNFRINHRLKFNSNAVKIQNNKRERKKWQLREKSDLLRKNC